MTPAERRDFLWELASGILWSFAIIALWIWADAGMFAFTSIALVMLPALAACLFKAVSERPQRTLNLAKAAIWSCAAALTALWIKYADDFAKPVPRGCLQLVCAAGFAPESGRCKAQTAARLDTLRGFATRQMPLSGAKAAVTPNANSPLTPPPKSKNSTPNKAAGRTASPPSA